VGREVTGLPAHFARARPRLLNGDTLARARPDQVRRAALKTWRRATEGGGAFTCPTPKPLVKGDCPPPSSSSTDEKKNQRDCAAWCSEGAASSPSEEASKRARRGIRAAARRRRRPSCFLGVQLPGIFGPRDDRRGRAWPKAKERPEPACRTSVHHDWFFRGTRERSFRGPPARPSRRAPTAPHRRSRSIRERPPFPWRFCANQNGARAEGDPFAGADGPRPWRALSADAPGDWWPQARPIGRRMHAQIFTEWFAPRAHGASSSRGEVRHGARSSSPRGRPPREARCRQGLHQVKSAAHPAPSSSSSELLRALR